MTERAAFERILVVMDGLDPTDAGLEYALDFVEGGGGELTVLIHTQSVASMGLPFSVEDMVVGYGDGWVDPIERAADRTGQRVRRLVRRRGARANVRRDIGYLGGCIRRKAKDSSLVVISQGRRGGLRPWAPWSSAARAAKHISKPLLIAPEEYWQLRRVRVAYDGTDMGQHALELGRQFARGLCVPLEVLTISKQPEEGEQVLGKARELLGGDASDTSFVQRSGKPSDVLITQSWSSTLLVMGSCVHSRLHRIVFGSVTDDVLRHGDGPVLIAGEPEAFMDAGTGPTTPLHGADRSAA